MFINISFREKYKYNNDHNNNNNSTEINSNINQENFTEASNQIQKIKNNIENFLQNTYIKSLNNSK